MDLYNVLMPIAILGSLSAGLVLFTKTLTQYYLRKKMIEKGYVNEENDVLLKNYSEENKISSLKWGILILSGGIGLVIIDAFKLNPETTMPFGVFTICVSLGFIIYFLIAKNLIVNK